MYNNYSGFIQRAESGSSIGSVAAGRASRDNPDRREGLAEWQPARKTPGPVRELKFVLRAYDAKGHFTRRKTHQLWLNPRVFA